MSTRTRRGPDRRQFLVAGAASIAAIASVDFFSASAHAATTCGAGSCTTTTVWMLDPDWGYARGPHGKTRLVSAASRRAAANRVARTEAEALDMNLHQCSFAPAVAVDVCAARADDAFAAGAADWNNPWNGATVSVLDLRRLPAGSDLFGCPAATPAIADPSSPSSGPTGGSGTGPQELAPQELGAEARAASASPGQLAFTGSSDRGLLLAGAGAVVVGTVLRLVGRRDRAEADAADARTDG